jgi:hypothetical protein
MRRELEFSGKIDDFIKQGLRFLPGIGKKENRLKSGPTQRMKTNYP